MINKIIFLTLFFLLLSCRSYRHFESKSIYLFKNNGIIVGSIETIEPTYWEKDDGNIDSLRIEYNLDVSRFLNILKNSKFKKMRQKPFLHPEYAVIMYNEGEKDTLYLDENLEKGYLTRSKIKFENKKDLLYNYFKEMSFLTEETIYQRQK